MSIKSKAVGLFAAASLAFGMFGAVAADDTVDVSVTALPGECTVEVAQSNVTFDAFQYVDDEWVRTSANGYHDVDIDVDTPSPSETCDVEITLTNAGGGDTGLAYEPTPGVFLYLPGGHFSIDLWPVGPGVNWLGSPVNATFGGDPLNASLYLHDLKTNQDPGTYTGTLNVSIVTGP